MFSCCDESSNLHAIYRDVEHTIIMGLVQRKHTVASRSKLPSIDIEWKK
jgi:hypothetical protein